MVLRLVSPCRQQKEEAEKDVQEFVIIGKFTFPATVCPNKLVHLMKDSCNIKKMTSLLGQTVAGNINLPIMTNSCTSFSASSFCCLQGETSLRDTVLILDGNSKHVAHE